MNISPLAGKPAQQNILVNIPRLVTAYYSKKPDASVADERVSFGTSGHRGSSINPGYLFLPKRPENRWAAISWL